MDYHPPSPSSSPDAKPEQALPEQTPPVPQEPTFTYRGSKKDLKHSGPGIASFVIAFVALLGYVFAFLYAGMQAATLLDAADSAGTIMLLGVLVLGLLALNIVGGVVGIIGLTLRDRRKVFAVIGTVLNALFVLLFMLMVAGVLVGAGAS